MNILVCVKHAVDESELRADNQGRPQLQGAQTKMSTFDRNAVEEAVKMKESKGGTVTVVTLGDADSKKTLKEALAMGADKAYLLKGDPGAQDTRTTSYYLARAISKIGGTDIVLCSEGASDTYHGLVGPMIAEWLKFPYVGYAKKIELAEAGVRCEEAFEEKVEVVEAPMPVVISVVSEINEPRYPTLLQIMQASKKVIEEMPLESLKDGESPEKAAQILEVKVQAMERKKMLFEGSAEESAQKLLEALTGEGVLKR